MFSFLTTLPAQRIAPEKGEDTRHKIAEILRKKGIRLSRTEMENLVDEIATELKGEAGE